VEEGVVASDDEAADIEPDGLRLEECDGAALGNRSSVLMARESSPSHVAAPSGDRSAYQA